MYNYTIRVSQLTDDNEYQYVGDMKIESDVTLTELKDDFDTCLELFDKVVKLIERKQRMKLLVDGEYWFNDDNIQYSGVMVEQGDNVHCLQLELVEE